MDFLSHSCDYETFQAWEGFLKEEGFQVSPEGHWGTQEEEATAEGREGVTHEHGFPSSHAPICVQVTPPGGCHLPQSPPCLSQRHTAVPGALPQTQSRGARHSGRHPGEVS